MLLGGVCSGGRDQLSRYSTNSPGSVQGGQGTEQHHCADCKHTTPDLQQHHTEIPRHGVRGSSMSIAGMAE